jgi:hypothetical protein
MASYRAVNGVLLALERFFEARMPAELSDGPVNARVDLLGSADIADPINGNVLGIYMHRIAVDPHGRSRFFPPQGTNQTESPSAELPLNLHLLLIASATSATIEANLMAWAMIALANESQLDISHLSENDSEWTQQELVTVTPDEVSTENLMRIWDVFQAEYTSSVPYVVRTIRLRLNQLETQGPAVISRVFPSGVAERK